MYEQSLHNFPFNFISKLSLIHLSKHSTYDDSDSLSSLTFFLLFLFSDGVFVCVYLCTSNNQHYSSLTLFRWILIFFLLIFLDNTLLFRLWKVERRVSCWENYHIMIYWEFPYIKCIHEKKIADQIQKGRHTFYQSEAYTKKIKNTEIDCLLIFVSLNNKHPQDNTAEK